MLKKIIIKASLSVSLFSSFPCAGPFLAGFLSPFGSKRLPAIIGACLQNPGPARKGERPSSLLSPEEAIHSL